jgi:hypothetical protein
VDFDSIFILIIIVAFVARAIGDALKGGKKAPPQQRPRSGPQQRLPHQPGQRPLPPGRPSEGTEGGSESAADLVPQDLWEILTGQRRVPTPPPRPAQPAPYAEEDEAIGEREDDSHFTVEPRAEDREAEALIRRRRMVRREARQFDHTPPITVSLENEPPPMSVRHAAFHRKLDAAPPIVATVQRPHSMVAELNFDQPGALRRAIIVQEVLGPPKGLE